MKLAIEQEILRLALVSGLILFASLRSEGQQVTEYIHRIQQQRQEKDKTFRDRDESPLDRKAIKKFQGLRYYPVDERYRVKAKLIVNHSPVLFTIPTTTTRLPEYTKYGDLEFELEGRTYRLEVYRNAEINKKPGFEDYLFVPFTDMTNGEETYEIGRYLDFRVPDSDEVFLDFNLAYNPYCAYSEGFSCPLPPPANQLLLHVEAGEKKYPETSKR